ncbi:60S ribosomal protein L36a [Hordeum vulgare]|nr:60S ribosomal protein L36a [Hordeum vulgare]
MAYGPCIQELFKHRNKKFDHKPFALHHCYKQLCKNDKWIQRVVETTPERSRLSISVEEDGEVDEDANNRPQGNKIAKERKKRDAYDGTYKEELVAMIEAEKVLTVEHKEEKMTRWNELKMLEDKKWKTKLAVEERKLRAKERRLTLKKERLCDAKTVEDCAIMFMNPATMNENARKY